MRNSNQSALSFNAGEMRALIEKFDWHNTPVGNMASWPQSLKTLVGIILNSQFPMLLLWGTNAENMAEFYNDPLAGIIHGTNNLPSDLKKSVSEYCPEFWEAIKPIVTSVTGSTKSAGRKNEHIRIHRNEKFEDVYLSISCSLVEDDAGQPAGVLVVCSETTENVINKLEITLLHEEEQRLNEELSATNEELAASNEEFYAANEELQDANSQLEKYIAEIKRKKEQLRESEEKYRMLFHHGPLPKWLYDQETLKIIDVNDIAISKYGYSRDEFLGITLSDMVVPGELPKLHATIGRGDGKDSHVRFSDIFTLLSKDKTLIRVELYGHAFIHQGRKTVMMVSNDITEREIAYNKLKINEAKLSNAQRLAQLGSWTFDPHKQVNDWSEELYKMLQIPLSNLSPGLSTLLKLLHPADRDDFLLRMQAFVSGEQEPDFEYRVILPDNCIKWLRQRGRIVRDKAGIILLFENVIQDITKSKNLELSLEESNKRFAYASQATSQAIWEWKSSRPDEFTEHGYLELFGYHLPDHVGHVSFWASKVHPEDLEHIWPMMLAARTDKGQQKWIVEYRFQKADGEYINIREIAILLRDDHGELLGMIGSMQDITQQKKEELQMRLLESVVTHSNDAVIITEASPLDEPGPRIIYVNQAFSRMTGYTAGEIIGKTPRILQGTLTDKDTLRQLSQQLRNNVPCEVTLVNYRKNGEEFWVNLSINYVAGVDKNDACFVAIQRDISERKREEIELKKLADDLYRHNKELQQFGYVVSHNLRAPVANIMGISTLLSLEKDDPETRDRCISDLEISINRLDEIIIDLSKILSATDGSAELAKEKIDLTKLLRGVKKDLNNAAALSGAKIMIPAGHVEIFSHKAYLHSVFYNLLSNAIKYRSARPLVIEFAIQKQADFVMISVADNGIGIDLSKHKKDLFKPYKRLNSSVDGKGLGLFLVKNHIDALNGEITIESHVGIGTKFIITLPVSTRTSA